MPNVKGGLCSVIENLAKSSIMFSGSSENPDQLFNQKSWRFSDYYVVQLCLTQIYCDFYVDA